MLPQQQCCALPPAAGVAAWVSSASPHHQGSHGWQHPPPLGLLAAWLRLPTGHEEGGWQVVGCVVAGAS